MAKKPTVKGLKRMCEELLALRAAYERYEALAAEIREDMAALRYTEMNLDSGRVFVSRTEQVDITPQQAISELGAVMASKVIVTRTFVSKEILAAFVRAGEVSEEQYTRLLQKAGRKPIARLYVRPAK